VHHDGNIETGCDGAHDVDIAGRVRTQTVVDVMGLGREPGSMGQKEESQRIGASRNGERDTLSRRRKGAAAEEGCEKLRPGQWDAGRVHGRAPGINV
jgi:hypothetical protein